MESLFGECNMKLHKGKFLHNGGALRKGISTLPRAGGLKHNQTKKIYRFLKDKNTY